MQRMHVYADLLNGKYVHKYKIPKIPAYEAIILRKKIEEWRSFSCSHIIVTLGDYSWKNDYKVQM